MTLEIRFPIYNSARPRLATATSNRVAAAAIYRKLWEIGKAFFRVTTYDPEHESSSIRINCAPDHKMLPEVFDFLKEAGWTPYFGKEVPQELRTTHFQVQLVRKYDTGDYDQAEYLRLACTEAVAPFIARDGESWIGKSSSARWHLDYGEVDGGQNYFASSELRKSLEDAGLRGLQFGLPLVWNDPALAEREYWEMNAGIVMPRCLLPTVRMVSSTMLDGSKEYSVTYDDGCYQPTEMVYLRSEVEAIGGFDVARNLEDLTWTKPNSGSHLLIVSQRFRQTLMALSVENVEYGIVRLVDRVEEAEFKLPDSLAYLA